jgi:hypothetical protein
MGELGSIEMQNRPESLGECWDLRALKVNLAVERHKKLDRLDPIVICG